MALFPSVAFRYPVRRAPDYTAVAALRAGIRPGDAELLDLPVQGRALHAQARRRASWAAEDPVGVAKRVQDMFAFRVRERHRSDGRCCWCGRRGGGLEIGKSNLKRRPFGEDDCPLDDVLQLAHVARPGV